jgi:hypothetical protein
MVTMGMPASLALEEEDNAILLARPNVFLTSSIKT